MIQSTGGEWTVEDLDAAGRLYQLPFYPEARRSNGCATHPGPTLGRRTKAEAIHLSWRGAMDCSRGACHRARIRATRWFA
jgi:hypothetical protein